MHLPEKLRSKLKTPLGTLLLEPNTNKAEISKYVDAKSFIITVGDATTEKLVRFGFDPSIQIVDGQEKRKKRDLPQSNLINENFTCSNPAGQITQESVLTIKKALKSKPPVRITVDGEEDLLVIPACVFAPTDSVIMYGQPNEGLVIVIVNEEIRDKAASILNSLN